MITQRPLKILHVLSQRPDATGSGIYIQAMLREAASAGHQNALVSGVQCDCPARPDGVKANDCRFVTFGADNAEIPFTIVGMSDVMPYASTRFCDLSPAQIDDYETGFARNLEAAVSTFRPDIIHSHHLWLVTALTRRLFPEIPMIVSCHGSDLRQFENCPGLAKRVVQACRRLEAVLALSHAQKQTIVDLYNIPSERVHVVGAGYNDGLFVPSTKPLPPPVEIVYAGKLSRAKGVAWMLRALGRIATPQWHLHLIGGGSGPQKAQCLELAGALGRRVTVYGAIPQDQLAEHMRRAHLFVLPSFFEGLPLVVIEALASGCRIVATKLPGVRELVGGMGAEFIDLVELPRLYEVDKPDPADEPRFEKNLQGAIQRQIHAAHRQPEIDLSLVGNQMAAFSWQGVFQKIESLYADRVG